MKCLKRLFNVIFLLSFVMVSIGYGDTGQTGNKKKPPTPGERLVLRNQYGAPILDARGKPINYNREQIQVQASQVQKPGRRQGGWRGNTVKQISGSPASWSYSIFGVDIGGGGMIVDTVGGRREIYLDAKMGDHYSCYWYTLYYNNATKTYEQGFVSTILSTGAFDEIIALRLADVTGGPGKEVVVATEKGSIHLYDQATKNYLKKITTAVTYRAMDLEIADIDNDGQNELILGGDHLYVYSGSGTLEWDMDIPVQDIVVGQMDNDSSLEMAVAGSSDWGDAEGYVIDCSSRTIQWTWPNNFGIQVEAADIDNDNRDELIANEGWYTVFAYDVERQLPKWSIPADLDIDEIYLTDIDNDSVVELILGERQRGGIIAYDTVTLKQEWSREGLDSGITNILVTDVDGDGKRELMWGGGYYSSGEDTFYIVNWQTGQIEWESLHLDGPFIGPECGDLDGDGKEELVVVSHEFEVLSGYSRRIMVFNINGNLRAISDPIVDENLGKGIWDLKLYDVDRDGKVEILVASAYNHEGVIEIYDFNANNTFNLKWTNSKRPEGSIFTSLSAGDIDGDGILEILGGTGGYIYAYDYNTGGEEWQSLYHGGSQIRTLGVSDLDNDGDQEIISRERAGDVYIFNGRTKVLDTIIFGSYTALTLINTNQSPPSIALGDEEGNIEILTYSGGSYQAVFSKDYSSGSIDGISGLSTFDELIFGTNGTLNIASPGGIKWTSATYGPVYGKRAVIPKGSSNIFSAGSYSVNSFNYQQLPFITVTRPNGGEEWVRGTSQTIYWNSSGTTGNVKIEYSTDNGGSWSIITSSTSNSGSYAWTVPDAVSDRCLVRVSETGGSISDTSDAVFSITAVAPQLPEIYLNRGQMNFSALVSGAATGGQTFSIANNGGGNLDWIVSVNASWLNCTPLSGTGYGVITVSVDNSGLAAGNYTGFITVSDPGASNSPQTITVYLTVKNASESQQPFGEFATPLDGSTVSSSIPVTGWVLDDLEVMSVKIYNGSSYVGDAVLVEGARPDVEQAYPGYPNNHKAGWGYMLLTNFLPGGGNGTYKLYAKAKDKEGNEVTLGSKTIIVDNANAVKPFGALDTPTQGGTASGNSFVNWGWVLTPQPNQIPTDGSTIKVWIDGVNVGNPTYNIYRSDIAAQFPVYANSNGAAGYFYLDTTVYTNGVHTIQWTATDSGGNTDGIGSRYFTIQNMGSGSAHGASTLVIEFDLTQISELPVGFSEPIRFKRGYGKNLEPRIITTNDKGVARVAIKELEHLELQLAGKESDVTGYVVAGEQLRPLPFGCSIKNGIFYWIPGPGFFGNYRLVFVVKDQYGVLSKREVVVRIGPRFIVKE